VNLYNVINNYGELLFTGDTEKVYCWLMEENSALDSPILTVVDIKTAKGVSEVSFITWFESNYKPPDVPKELRRLLKEFVPEDKMDTLIEKIIEVAG